MEGDIVERKGGEKFAIVKGRTTTEKAKPGTKKVDRADWSELLLKQAIAIATKVKANAILVNMETVAEIAPFGKTVEKGFRVIFITKRKVCLEKASELRCDTILLPDVHLSRDGYMKLGFLEAISKGLLSKGDVVVHVGGQLEKGYMDTIVILRVGDESEIVSFTEESPFPPNIQHEVFESLLVLVMEMAYEGREGRPIGCTFVLGDHENVLQYSRPLVFNPFQGHPEDALHITKPEVRETLKEFSSIDGAFVIRDDGVVLAAGRYLNAAYHGEPMPQGLGARHASAAAITGVTNSVALVVSESSGRVTIFRGGRIITTIEKAAPPAPRSAAGT